MADPALTPERNDKGLLPVDKPQRYFLEMVRGNDAALIAAVEIPNVFSYVKDPTPAEHADWTLGSLPVEQHKGIRQHQLVLRGRSGLEEREFLSVDASSQQTSRTASGRQRFLDFQDFVNNYYAEAAQYRSAFVQNSDRWPRMIFRAIREGDFFYVRDIRLPPSENVGSSRMTYEFTLNMTAIGEALRTPQYNIITSPSLAITRSEARLKATLAAATASPSTTVTGADTRTVAIASDAVPGPGTSVLEVMQRVPGYLGTLLPPVTSWLDRVSEYVGATSNIFVAVGALPRSLVADLYAFSVQTAAQLYAIWDAFDGVLREDGRPWMLALKYAVSDVGRALLTLLGAAGATAPTEVPSQMSQPTQGSPAASAPVGLETVRQNEDLFRFAYRTLGDASRWADILTLNGMTSATTLGDGSPFTSGVILAIPTLLNTGLQTLPDRPSANVFGTDLAWSITAWDFVPMGEPVRDIKSITGPPNLQARLLHRFTKEQGSDLTAPNLGMPAVTGQAQSASLAALIAAQSLTQATADGAVRKVKDAFFLQVANTYTINLTIVPIAGRTLSYANIPVGIATGGP